MADAVKQLLSVQLDEQEIHPDPIKEVAYGEGYIVQGFHKDIDAGASGVVIDLSKYGTVENLILAVSQDDLSVITFKKVSPTLGTSVRSFSVSPIAEISEPLTQIEVSNSGTSSVRLMGWVSSV